MRIDKRFILLNIPYLLFFWIADKICYIYRITEGLSMNESKSLAITAEGG